MRTLDNRGFHRRCRPPPGPKFPTATTPLRRASCGSHQPLGMFSEWMLLGSLEAESFREKFGDVRLHCPLGTLEKNCRVRTKFIDHLAAGAARRTRDTMVIRNGDRLN